MWKNIGIEKVLVIKCNPNLFLLGVEKLPAQLNVLSCFAEEQWLESTALDTLDNREEVFSGELSAILVHSHYLK